MAASNAGAHDLQVAKRILPQLRNCSIYADKIYSDIPLKEELEEKQKLHLNTPVKRKKGQKHLAAADRYLSTAVSIVRGAPLGQPIESLFAWLQDKVKIHDATKVRSEAGALIHTFGKLAAAIWIFVFNY